MIEKKPFGRTGHQSTRAIFGAAALGSVSQKEADETLDVLLKYGVNHIDTAANYGESELRIGPWMAHYRNQFFLATKTQDRTYDKARESIHRSLDRLRVSQIDMIQLHFLVDPAEWKVAMGPGGALEAVVEAREQGLVRFIGVTGHELSVPVMHKRSLERFDFDSVLLPYSHMMMQNTEYAANLEALLAMCAERTIAVQTIKGITRSPWASGHAHTAATWYQPLTDQSAIDSAVHWILGRPEVFLNTPGDIHILPKVLDAVSRFQRRPTEEELMALTAQYEMAPLFT